MIQHRLRAHLDQVAARYRRLWFWRTLGLGWLLAAIAGLAMWLTKTPTGVSHHVAALSLLLGGCVVTGLASWRAAKVTRSYEWVARQVEFAFPELRTCLLTAVEQRPELPDGNFGYLQSRVIREALDHAQKHAWSEIVPSRRIAATASGSFTTLALFVAALVAVAFYSGSPGDTSDLTQSNPLIVGGSFTVGVEPGDVEVEKGSSLLVLARVVGSMPAEAQLVLRTDAGKETALPMSASLNDPVFGGRIPRVEQPLTYHADVGGQITPEFRVTVFEYPRLERADAALIYPEYTGLPERLIQDVRSVSAVEGTQLTLRCKLNKPVASAVLVAADTKLPAAPIPLFAQSADPLVYEATLVCQQSRRLELKLVDDVGRQNVKPIHFAITVLPNQPPSLKPVFPGRDLEVSALEELDTKATVSDDFGVRRAGLTYSLAGQAPVDVVLAEKAAAKDKHELNQTIGLEELGAEPDQLLSYHWWVEDFGPQGELRRTSSDMYFAEVRPFEEIFRQGEQPAGGEQQQQQQNQQGQGQNAQQAQELAKLQKDIINATWNLIRRETGATLAGEFAADAEQVRLSQAEALEQASALAEQVEDEQSQEHVDAVLQHMQTAIEQLQAAAQTPAREPLTPALAAEQAAYQSLLKLRAREHEVVRQQQQQNQQNNSQSSQARSGQQQQQLEQLDLREEENRYETERTAQQQQEQESPQDRENRQVLNRLRELARRQHDLNDRLKELQSALEAAQTEEQQEEIRRQLKRLEDEQRQILQDTDELQQRLDQPENLEQMAEEREQLQETREQVRRASEALEQQRVTQAAAAGSRAEQQFDDLREEFRRRASNRFGEELQNMREAAQELDERQGELSQRIAQAAQPQQPAPSLRTEDPRAGIAEELDEQRQRLANLLEQMKHTIQEAEESEPLLSERLYETARNLQDHDVDRALQETQTSMRAGFMDDAQTQESTASQGLRELREGIDRAAEGVLGDETEALRRAREELQDLAQELQQEIARNSPEGETAESERPGAAGENESQPAERTQEGERPAGPAGERPAGEGTMGGGSRPAGEGTGSSSSRPAGEGTSGRQRGGAQSGERPSQEEQSPRESPESQPQEGGQRSGQQEDSSQPGEQQPGEQQGGQPTGGQPSTPQQAGRGRGAAEQAGEQPNGPQDQRGQRGERGPRSLTGPSENTGGGATGGFEQDSRPSQTYAPIAGEDFREWSDRLRDVEEMVEDPDLRAEAARIRERARAMRVDLKRHSAEPNWDLVRTEVREPLVELERRVAEELLRRTSKKALTPLDRDNVPPEYAEETRRYYERLGSGQ